MATITGVTYKAIVSVGVESYDIVPFDLYGNLLGEVTVNVDTAGGAVTINLPAISTLKSNYNTRIVVVRTAGANNVTVTAGGSDKIGSASTVVLNAINKSVEVVPVEAINWYGVITA